MHVSGLIFNSMFSAITDLIKLDMKFKRTKTINPRRLKTEIKLVVIQVALKCLTYKCSI